MNFKRATTQRVERGEGEWMKSQSQKLEIQIENRGAGMEERDKWRPGMRLEDKYAGQGWRKENLYDNGWRKCWLGYKNSKHG
jgi:hypothetical protein